MRLLVGVLLIVMLLNTTLPAQAQSFGASGRLGNSLRASQTNGETIGGVDEIRLYGPWRAKDTGALTDGYADLQGGGSAQTLRLVVYALQERNGGYAPGRLVAVSADVTIPAGQSRRWVRFSFPAQGGIVRNTRYALGVWFVGAGAAQLWTEDRIGGRWDIAAVDGAPRDLVLSPDTARNEDLPGLYTSLRVAPLAPPAAGMRRLSPSELPLSVPVTNPLSGMHRWRDLAVVPGMREATAYDRYTWSQVEGETPGSYDWSVIYNDIYAALSRGQMYAFRVRARVTSYETPAYLAGRDFNDPYFRERHAALHRAIKAEFDGNPAIAWIDLDGPGDWGEWRNGDWDQITQASRNDVIRYLAEIWRDAQTPTVMFTVGAPELAAMRAAFPASGLRNDIWGGEGASAQLWSQQAPAERTAVLDNGERNLLLLGEVDSAVSGWDVRTLHQQILWFGPHTIGNGNFKAQGDQFSRFAPAERAELKAALGKLGHRLYIAHVDVPQTLSQNGPNYLTFYWHNRNVTAPVGNDVGTAYLQLANSDGQIVASYPLGVDVGSLLPTDIEPHRRTERISLSGLPAGTYTLQVQIVLPTGRTLNLGNAGRTDDGAYPLGRVRLVEQRSANLRDALWAGVALFISPG